MKKITIASIVTVLGIIAFALPTMAATTASLYPAAFNVTAGNTFNVTVTVNPQGTANMVEKLEVSYPANLLEVTSFAQPSTWMSLTQPGYDATDNVNGILLKTAGYPGGVSTATTFGTITFRAKGAGNGTIKIGSNSLAFEAKQSDRHHW